MRILFKLVTAQEWREFRKLGRFSGSAVDKQDGFIHLSYADQVRETATRHFSGIKDLVLLAIDPARCGAALRDEVSRGGALFPHLYAELSMADVLWNRPVGLDAAGVPVLPALEPEP